MEQSTIIILFFLLRSAICGNQLEDNEKKLYSKEILLELSAVAKKHDLSHLLALALRINGLCQVDSGDIVKAVYRYEQLNYEYNKLCNALETAHIPFIPLKGSVLRKHYPEPWMRTSCDIDVLVRKEDLKSSIKYLVDNLGYIKTGQSTHDVGFTTQGGQRIELHFDLLEEGRANNAIKILDTVWDNVILHEDSQFYYEMTDEFFYFYHIVHMAKHFEEGGCGIRPFVDLYILDNLDGADKKKRDELLEKGGLFKFAGIVRYLSQCWLGCEQHNEISLKVQNYILNGGVYGNTQNRVALQQTKKGGWVRYIFSRIFIPYDKLKRYYPILEKYPWLTPFMQMRRWFMLLNPKVAQMAKSELLVNKDIDKLNMDNMSNFLSEIGL